eukprot:scaffold15140_cov63-Cyclotella_meneghiniana.AAC.4
MVMVKEGLELASSNGGADHSGYVDELGVCGSDRFEKCLSRSSMVTTAIRRHSLVDVSKTCRSDGKITYEIVRKAKKGERKSGFYANLQHRYLLVFTPAWRIYLPTFTTQQAQPTPAHIKTMSSYDTIGIQSKDTCCKSVAVAKKHLIWYPPYQPA